MRKKRKKKYIIKQGQEIDAKKYVAQLMVMVVVKSCWYADVQCISFLLFFSFDVSVCVCECSKCVYGCYVQVWKCLNKMTNAITISGSSVIE